jgi:hypothetical protein
LNLFAQGGHDSFVEDFFFVRSKIHSLGIFLDGALDPGDHRVYEKLGVHLKALGLLNGTGEQVHGGIHHHLHADIECIVP